MPVIILTSKSSPFDLARGALAGCDTYLTKPVPLKELEAAVVKQLRKALAIDDISGLIRMTSAAAPANSSAAANPAPTATPAQQPMTASAH
jgi:DNA-binding response OmpR family regulator